MPRLDLVPREDASARDADAAPTEHRTGRDGDRLRVAVIGPSRFPIVEPYAGGLESFVGDLVAGLRDRGHRVLLFANEGTPGAQPETLPPGDWQPGQLARQDVSMPAERFMADHHGHLRVMSALRTRYADQIDVVHNNSLHYLPIALADTLSAPMLTTLHTPPTPWLESAVAAAPGASAFSAVSHFTAAQWAARLPGCEVIRNGVPHRDWPYGSGGPRLLWYGRIVPEKAPHLALDVAERVGRPLDLIGPIHDADYFAARVAPRLGPQARYLGQLGGAVLRAAVGGAAVLLVTPEWDEPFGLVAAEAPMTGTPVVAFDRGGVSEVVHPGGCADLGIVVPPGDVAAMADAVRRAIRLDRRRVARAARRHLSFDSVVSTYESLYRRLLLTRSQVEVFAS